MNKNWKYVLGKCTPRKKAEIFELIQLLVFGALLQEFSSNNTYPWSVTEFKKSEYGQGLINDLPWQ